jgi:predicted nucleic acid-binding protein
MKKIVFDTHALITFFRKETKYEMIKNLLVKVANNELESFMCSVNVGELYYMMIRKGNTGMANDAVAALKLFPIHFTDADFTHCLEAAALKAKYKLSYADAFAAALAIKKDAELITGDPEFKALISEKNFKLKFIGD